MHIVRLAFVALFSCLAASHPSVPVIGSNQASAVARDTQPTCPLKESPPKRLACGVHGYAIFGSDATNQTVHSFTECQEFCLDQNSTPGDPGYEFSNCNLFAYNPQTRLCSLFEYEHSGYEFVESATEPTIFYDTPCFNCAGRKCQQEPNVNIVNNPGFELSGSLHGPWLLRNVNVSIVAGHNSPRALELYGETDYSRLYQYVRLCPNNKYVYSADYRLIGTQSVDGSSLLFGVGGGFFLDLDVPHGWSTFGATFTCGYATVSELTFEIQYPGYAFDNIRLYVVEESALTTVGPNLVQNGGFETGDLAPWKLYHDNFFFRPHHNVTEPGLTKGNYKFEFHQKIHHFYEEEPYDIAGFYLSQDKIPTVKGKWYQLSFDYLRQPNEGNHDDIRGAVKIGKYTFYLGNGFDKIVHFSEAFLATESGARMVFEFTAGEATYEKRENTFLDNVQLSVLR